MTSRVECRHGANCKHLASRYPVMCMVSVGSRRGQHAPLRMHLVGHAICAECQIGVSVQDFLLPEGRERIAEAMHAAGRARPDFDGAWLEWGRVGDREWITGVQLDGQGQTRQ